MALITAWPIEDARKTLSEYGIELEDLEPWPAAR
jgi:hypothetical protein